MGGHGDGATKREELEHRPRSGDFSHHINLSLRSSLVQKKEVLGFGGKRSWNERSCDDFLRGDPKKDSFNCQSTCKGETESTRIKSKNIDTTAWIEKGGEFTGRAWSVFNRKLI
jgi:hypothetical protein